MNSHIVLPFVRKSYIDFQKKEGANTIMKDVDRIIRKASLQQCSSLEVGKSVEIHKKNLGMFQV